MSFSNTSPFYGQQFFTAGASHRESNCSSVGSSLHGSTGPARPCCGTGILWAHSLGSSMACRWISSPLWAPWPGWGQLPHHGLNYGLQGNLATQTHFAHWKLWDVQGGRDTGCWSCRVVQCQLRVQGGSKILLMSVRLLYQELAIHLMGHSSV